MSRAGHTLERAPEGADEETWLEALTASAAPDVLVLDVRTALSPGAVQRLRARVPVVASIDDASDRRLACEQPGVGLRQVSAGA